MKKTYIARSDKEAKGLHDGTVTVLVIPMKTQPTEWTTAADGKLWPALERRGRCERADAPYAPGDEIRVKETMPGKAIRTRLLCRSIEVKRVAGVWVWCVSAEARRVSLEAKTKLHQIRMR